MRELDTEMQRVAQTAAIAHDEQLFSLLEAVRHLFGHQFDLVRVYGEEGLVHSHALAGHRTTGPRPKLAPGSKCAHREVLPPFGPARSNRPRSDKECRAPVL